ncbi:tachykinin-3 isoform X1 [Phasianus colchicus]|uniref:tachykinin-3 isoform X1 n=1 Tax=Phasianus colchicus TaxID=9054 RepID=UPI00129EE27C|nr:tachykinin-3 isoform X1 [Phasianus colchicus]
MRSRALLAVLALALPLALSAPPGSAPRSQVRPHRRGSGVVAPHGSAHRSASRRGVPARNRCPGDPGAARGPPSPLFCSYCGRRRTVRAGRGGVRGAGRRWGVSPGPRARPDGSAQRPLLSPAGPPAPAPPQKRKCCPPRTAPGPAAEPRRGPAESTARRGPGRAGRALTALSPQETCTTSSWGSWGNGRRNPGGRRAAAGARPRRDTLSTAPPPAAPQDPPRTAFGLPGPPAPRREERPRRGGRDAAEPSREPRGRAESGTRVSEPRCTRTARIQHRTARSRARLCVCAGVWGEGRGGEERAAYRDPPRIATRTAPRSPPQFPSGPLRRCGPVGAGGRRKAAPVAAGARSGGRRAEGGAVPLCERAGMVRGAGRSPLPCHLLDAGQHLLPPQLMRA